MWFLSKNSQPASASKFKCDSVTAFFSMNINVTNHEEHVLMRRFDHNGDGKISMEEFYNTLAQEF